MRFAEDKSFARLGHMNLCFLEDFGLYVVMQKNHHHQQQKLLHLPTVCKRNEFKKKKKFFWALTFLI